MRTTQELKELASATDFRPEALEKVDKLLTILKRLDENESSHGRWVLKGGTALNLFHLDVPRLSVDIDINFTGVDNVEALEEARTAFEKVLSAVCARSGCSVRRAPVEHAGGKFRLRYASLLGGEQNLEVDVSYVARVPLWGVERRPCLLSKVSSATTPLLTLPELAAGKIAALLARTAARDAFDTLELLQLSPTLFDEPKFRLALVTAIASARLDLRRPAPPEAPSVNDIATQLVPLLRIRGGAETHNAGRLIERLRSEVLPVVAKTIQWSEEESLFLDRLLDDGELEPEHLTEESDVQRRISRQPMLRWKQLHVRQHKGLDAV